MKSILSFVIGVVVGVLLCYKFGYEYLTEKLSENISMIVGQVSENGIGTGSSNLLEEYEGAANGILEEKKGEIKIKIKEEISNYIQSQIDEMFK